MSQTLSKGLAHETNTSDFFLLDISVDLAVAEEVETSDDDTKITDVVELPENMENGRPYFSDRGSYVLLSILSQWQIRNKCVYTAIYMITVFFV